MALKIQTKFLTSWTSSWKSVYIKTNAQHFAKKDKDFAVKLAEKDKGLGHNQDSELCLKFFSAKKRDLILKIF